MSAESKLLPMKRPAKPEAEAETKAEMPPPKAGFLPTGLSRAIVLGSLILSLIVLTPLLLGHRYELVAANRSENALVYRIDTLTGRVSLCSATQCLPVSEKDSGG